MEIQMFSLIMEKTSYLFCNGKEEENILSDKESAIAIINNN